MQHHIEVVTRRQSPARPEVPPRWRAMLAASRDLRNLAAVAQACGQSQATRQAAWPRIEAELLNLIGSFAVDRRMDSARHWDVAKRELRRLLQTGVQQ